MLALEGDLRRQGGADDYDRHRDDDHPAGHWDEGLGEFFAAVREPTKPATRRINRPNRDELSAGRCEVRPSAIDAALSPILELRQS